MNNPQRHIDYHDNNESPTQTLSPATVSTFCAKCGTRRIDNSIPKLVIALI